MSKSKPILFSSEMIKAVLDGRKIQTRRAIKLPPWSTNWDDFEISELDEPLIICEKTGCLAEIASPYGGPGDMLWVRETWRTHEEYDLVSPKNLPKDSPIQYKADLALTGSVGVSAKWRPSIFMPRWASRIDLVVENVKIERVQDITLQDCIAEGMTWQDEQKARASFTGAAYQRDWWKSLWNSINAKRGYGWDTNPFVWVVEFSLD